MISFPRPTGTEISAEQARALDDSFLTSNPLGYFQSRIDSLIAWSEAPPVDYTAGLGHDVLARLGLSQDVVGQTDENTRATQIASDAFTLRHHVAECTVRLFASLVRTAEGSAKHPSLWAEVAEDREQGIDFVRRLNTFFRPEDSGTKFAEMILPLSLRMEEDSARPEYHRALQVQADWLAWACRLLVDDGLDMNSANNKSKHGLSVRTRDDVKLTFTTVAPDTDGNVPLSALTGPKSFDVFDSPLLESLAGPPSKVGRETRGLELSQVRLHTPSLLAEATMISLVHGSLFHVAAARHFADRPGHPLPPFPTLPLRPTPDELLGKSVLGMRWPVTLPNGANQSGRKAAIVRYDVEVPLNVGTESRTGHVVEG